MTSVLSSEPISILNSVVVVLRQFYQECVSDNYICNTEVGKFSWPPMLTLTSWSSITCTSHILLSSWKVLKSAVLSRWHKQGFSWRGSNNSDSDSKVMTSDTIIDSTQWWNDVTENSAKSSVHCVPANEIIPYLLYQTDKKLFSLFVL